MIVYHPSEVLVTDEDGGGGAAGRLVVAEGTVVCATVQRHKSSWSSHVTANIFPVRLGTIQNKCVPAVFFLFLFLMLFTHYHHNIRYLGQFIFLQHATVAVS